MLASCILLITTPVIAKETYQGHRIGLGYSSGEETFLNSDKYDAGDGLRLEYGYDFNHIIGLNLSVSKNKITEGIPGLISIDYDSTNYQIDTDIGYAFQFEGVSVKPYGLLGFSKYKEKQTLNFIDSPVSETYKDSAVVVGFGVRTTFLENVYADLRTQYLILEDSDLRQISLTVGYKF